MSVWQGEQTTSSRSAREARKKQGSADVPAALRQALHGGENGA
nr:MAG TPA: hypothetical protein [Caudoviricetes sp.]